MGFYIEIFEARVLGENLYLHQRFTVFKVEYFLYIIQVMLQYTPSFNKVCYTLSLQGCFLWIYKTKYYASARGYVVHLCARQFFYFFKKERKIRVIFFLCRGCDILVLIFLFWFAKFKRLLFFVIFLYTINKTILGLQLFQDWDVYTGRSYYEAYASGPLISRKQLF